MEDIFIYREMTMADYPTVMAFWQGIGGIGLDLEDADSPEGMTFFLASNPGLSLLAFRQEQLVGTVLCGHDGRRGYINHLAVSPYERGNGVGKELVNRILKKLAKIGIKKANLFVYDTNLSGLSFWEHLGWEIFPGLYLLSRSTEQPEDRP